VFGAEGTSTSASTGPASGRGFGSALRTDPDPRPVRADDDERLAAVEHHDVFGPGGIHGFGQQGEQVIEAADRLDVLAAG
jgi:hypothetical protein